MTHLLKFPSKRNAAAIRLRSKLLLTARTLTSFSKRNAGVDVVHLVSGLSPVVTSVSKRSAGVGAAILASTLSLLLTSACQKKEEATRQLKEPTVVAAQGVDTYSPAQAHEARYSAVVKPSV